MATLRRDPVQLLRRENDPDPLIRKIDRSRLPRGLRIYLARYVQNEIARRRDSPRGGRRRHLAEEIRRSVQDLHARGVPEGIAKQVVAVKFDCSTRTIHRVMRHDKPEEV